MTKSSSYHCWHLELCVIQTVCLSIYQTPPPVGHSQRQLWFTIWFAITGQFVIRKTYLNDSEDLSLDTEFVSSWSPLTLLLPIPAVALLPDKSSVNFVAADASPFGVVLWWPPTACFAVPVAVVVVVLPPDTIAAFVTDDDETVDTDDEEGDWIKGLAVAIFAWVMEEVIDIIVVTLVDRNCQLSAVAVVSKESPINSYSQRLTRWSVSVDCRRSLLCWMLKRCHQIWPRSCLLFHGTAAVAIAIR